MWSCCSTRTPTRSPNSRSHSILIEGDTVRLGQAFDDVISNAIKFTPEDGRVDVTLAQAGGRATLTVADTGMGMTAADSARRHGHRDERAGRRHVVLHLAASCSPP